MFPALLVHILLWKWPCLLVLFFSVRTFFLNQAKKVTDVDHARVGVGRVGTRSCSSAKCDALSQVSLLSSALALSCITTSVYFWQAFPIEPRKVLRKYCDPLVMPAMGGAIGMSKLNLLSQLRAVGNL